MILFINQCSFFVYSVNVNACLASVEIQKTATVVEWNEEINARQVPNVRKPKNVKQSKLRDCWNVDQLVKMYIVGRMQFALAIIISPGVNAQLDLKEIVMKEIHTIWLLDAKLYHAFTTSIVHRRSYVIAWHILVTMFAMNQLAVKTLFALLKTIVQFANARRDTKVWFLSTNNHFLY